MIQQPNRSRASRKANGVFYTPPSVAAYIARQTLAPLLERIASKPIAALRVLDPACGGGVFLHEVYKFLITCHSQHRSTSNAERHLSFPTRRKVLLNHIFGVDRDAEAVEATKSSLARLCLAVHETKPLTNLQHKRFSKLKASLSANIRQGDALIEPDGWDREESTKQDENLYQRIRPFDWQKEFCGIMNDGGFDAVIGNPPYINIRQLTASHSERVKNYLRRRYTCAHRAFDSYVLFIERAHELLKGGGRCGFIVPNKIASLEYASVCRKLLLEQTTLHQIDDVANIDMFSGAGVYPYILVWEKRQPQKGHRIVVRHAESITELQQEHAVERIRQRDLNAQRGFALGGELDLESRVATQPLGQRARLHSGTTGFVAHNVADSLIDVDDGHLSTERNSFEFIVSGNIDRYAIRRGNVRFMNRFFDRPALPSNWSGLTEGKRRLYQESKIVIAGMTRRLEAAFDPGGLALGVQVYAAIDFVDDPRYILGLLNSKLMSFVFRLRFQAKRLAGGYLAINKGQLVNLPICMIDHDDAAQRSCHHRIIRLVDKMSDLTDKLNGTTSESNQTDISRLLCRTDGQIDRLVSQLYKLTPDEIARVSKTVVD